MEKVPENLRHDPLSAYLMAFGLKRISQGKVRDMNHVDSERLLLVASDRGSIFDFVLNALFPKKGEVLTALTHFWLTKVLWDFHHHLIPAETKPAHYGENQIPNGAYDLVKNLSLNIPLERCLLVKNLSGEMYPFEMIFRHHIGGSVFKEYLKTGMAGGQRIIPNLPRWSKLNRPIFTPSTKEEEGHDINVSSSDYYEEMINRGKDEEAKRVVTMLEDAYCRAYKYAEERGILILDTKLEVAGRIIADETFTPDSSRFVDEKDWKEAMIEGREPKFLDKEPLRDWGRSIKTPFKDAKKQPIVGINLLDPKNEEHVYFVHSLKVPKEIIHETTVRYLQIFERLTGSSLNDYQNNEMGCGQKF